MKGLPSDDDTWRVGQTIADLYEVRGINREGGMAIVYFVWHAAWRIELVIKSPRPELFADATARKRFLGEAETWVKLGMHPNIVTAYYVRELEGFPRIVIEKMNGGSLKQGLHDGKIKDLTAALDIAIQIVSGLAYAQEQRPDFVHRDLKPANVLLTPTGEAKVTDFGLVEAVGEQVGTPAYMAPEVWTNPRRVTPAADLYSFGVLLYELLTGRRPFDRGDKGASLGQIRGGRGVEGSLGALRSLWVKTRSSFLGADIADAHEDSLGGHLDIQRITDSSIGEATESPAVLSMSDLQFYRTAHTGQMPPPPSSFKSGLPEEIDDLCLSLLAKKPARRPASAQQVAELLRRIYEAHVGHVYPREMPQEAELVADTLNNRALSFLDLERKENALACWREALAKNPTHLESTFNFGYWQWKHGAIDDAQYIKRVTELERLQGARTEYWEARASVHLERGDHHNAQFAMQHKSPEGEPDILDFPPAPRYEQEKVGHTRFAINAVACSSGGDYMAAVGTGDLLKLFDAESLGLIRDFEGGEAYQLLAVMFLGDDLILSGSFGYDVRLWRTATGEYVGPLKVSNSFSIKNSCETASCFVLSPDHSLLVCSYTVTSLSVGGIMPILVWDLRTAENIQLLEGHRYYVDAVCLIPGEKQLLSVGGGPVASEIKLWNLESGRCLATIDGGSGLISSAAVSSDGRLALTGGSDACIKLWDLDARRSIKTLKGHAGAVRTVAFARDERFVISGSKDATIKLWHWESGRCMRTLEGHTDSVYSIAHCPDGEHIVSGGHDRTIRKWLLRPALASHFSYLLSRPRGTGEALKNQSAVAKMLNVADDRIHAGSYRQAYEFLRQAQSIPGYERDPKIADRINSCAKYGRRAGFRNAYRTVEFFGHREGVTSVRFSPATGLLASGSKDGEIRVWDIETGNLVKEFGSHQWGVSAIAWADDGEHVVSGARTAKWESERTDDTLQLWEARTGRCVSTFRNHKVGVGCATFTRDGSGVVSGDWGDKGKKDENLLRLWDRKSGRCLRMWEGHKDAVTAVDISPDGSYMVSASRDRTLRLWDVSSPRCVRALSGHAGAAYAVRFSPDGRLVLSAGGDDLLRLWEVSSGECLYELQKHQATVYGLAFSPDGLYALSCSDDRLLILWEISSGRYLQSFQGHTDGVLTLDFSSEGRYGASGGYDGVIKLWEFDWDWEFPTDVGG